MYIEDPAAAVSQGQCAYGAVGNVVRLPRNPRNSRVASREFKDPQNASPKLE